MNGVTTRYLVNDKNPKRATPKWLKKSSAVQFNALTPMESNRISQSQLISGTWTRSFYGYDGMGSARLLTDSTGTVTDTFDYDAWGNAVNTTGTTPNLYLYRGEQYDSDLGLYYLRARYFNPLTGRFLTKDASKKATC